MDYREAKTLRELRDQLDAFLKDTPEAESWVWHGWDDEGIFAGPDHNEGKLSIDNLRDFE